MGAAAGVAAALRVDRRRQVVASAQGIAGSDGERHHRVPLRGSLHQAHASRAGPRRLACARSTPRARRASTGPRTVWEGPHGLLHGFANSRWKATGAQMTRRVRRTTGSAQTIAFKPYACGTMAPSVHRLCPSSSRREAYIEPEDRSQSIICETSRGDSSIASGNPLPPSRRPPNAYAGEVLASRIAWRMRLLHGNVGLEAFTDTANAADPAHASRLPRRSAT